MDRLPNIARRNLVMATATVAAAIPMAATATSALAAEQGSQAASQPTQLAEVPLGPDTKLTIGRRGQVALFGLNRPTIQNRIDPETFRALAKALYDYDHDASLRAAILFGHGEHCNGSIYSTHHTTRKRQQFLSGGTRIE